MKPDKICLLTSTSVQLRTLLSLKLIAYLSLRENKVTYLHSSMTTTHEPIQLGSRHLYLTSYIFMTQLASFSDRNPQDGPKDAVFFHYKFYAMRLEMSAST